MNSARVLLVLTLALMSSLGSPDAARAKQQVEVTNTPLPVEVENTVSVRDADNPARQPVQHKCVCQISDGQAINTDPVTLPTGKRLVIEQVTVRALLPTGQVPEVQIFTGTSGLPSGTVSFGHYIALPVGPRPATGLTDLYQATQPTRIYADPGSTVTIHVARNQTTDQATFEVTWSGHLVDLP